MKIKPSILASILNIDWLHLHSQLNNLKKLPIYGIHYDVMDFHFVNNLSVGPLILTEITNKFPIFVEGHMMVELGLDKLISFWEAFIKAGVQLITMHYEALSSEQIEIFLSFCEKNNIQSGLAINPNTSEKLIFTYLARLDYVLIMSVEPGFGAQTFIPGTIPKVQSLQAKIMHERYQTLIGVDGGIDVNIGLACIKAGANVLIMGSYLFKPNIHLKEELLQLHSLLTKEHEKTSN